MIVLDLLVLVPLWSIAMLLLRWLEGDSRYLNAILLAFYVTIPPFIYDFAYCGIYLGYGLGFITKFWYLSVYYVIPWIILPPNGIWLDKREQQRKRRH